MTDLKNGDPSGPSARAAAFAARLADVYGDDLVSVVLYGSAARGEHREGVSDLNLLVLLRAVEAPVLRRGSELAREWVAAGNPPPLMMSEREWRESVDVFPIEYSDIRDAHVVVHGPDPLDGIGIDWSDLRHQCEHELRGKLIQLREAYLLSAGDAEQLGGLLHHSLPTFLTLFRTALRLAGETVPRRAEDVVLATARVAAFDPEPVLAVQRARGSGAPLRPDADDPIVAGYLAAVKQVARWLDGTRQPPDGATPR